MNRLSIRVCPVSLMLLLGFLTGCGSPAGDLGGRWELVEINDIPVAESPAVRLGLADDPDQSWLEEKLVSRTLEVSDEEREFLDRTVVHINQQRTVDTVRDPEAPPVARTEIVDTVLLAGTVEVENDTARFRATPSAGVISHSGSNLPGASPQEYRRSIPLSILGSDSAHILVGTWTGDQLRLRSPDGTDYTFVRVESDR